MGGGRESCFRLFPLGCSRCVELSAVQWRVLCGVQVCSARCYDMFYVVFRRAVHRVSD